MKISHKLRLMTGGAVLALILTGLIGLFIANGLNKSTEIAYGKTLPSVQKVDALKFNMQAVAIGLLKINLLSSPEAIPPLEKEVDRAKKNVLDILSSYADSGASPELKNIAADEEAFAVKYFAAVDKVLNLLKTGKRDEALSHVTELSSLRIQVSNKVDEHVEYVLTEAKGTADDAESTVTTNLQLLTALIVLSSLLIIGVNYYIGRAINKSLDAIQRAIVTIDANLDFTVSAAVHSNDEIGIVSKTLNRLLEKLRMSLTDIADNIKVLSDTSETLTTASDEVAKASAMQSDSASSMASSVEEMSVSITHVSDRSGDVHHFAEASGGHADKGSEAVAQMSKDIEAISAATVSASDKIKALDKSTGDISAVVAVIKDVAEQTNLLALNAAIEAARAGEQGRGFAVVADEVRKLAERTAKSTVEISAMIDMMREGSKEAVDSMSEAMTLVAQGVEQSKVTAEIIETIGKESHETVVMIDEIRAALSEQRQASNLVASGIESIAQASEESSVAAKNTAGIANDLDRLAHNVGAILSKYTL